MQTHELGKAMNGLASYHRITLHRCSVEEVMFFPEFNEANHKFIDGINRFLDTGVVEDAPWANEVFKSVHLTANKAEDDFDENGNGITNSFYLLPDGTGLVINVFAYAMQMV